MPFPPFTLKFLILCIVWGLTWIAMKVGIAVVPPFFFAATRFAAAGLVLSVWAHRGLRAAGWGRADLVRLLAASVLMIALCYGPLLWGMRHVSSGTAAVLEMSLTPIALLGFGIALSQERGGWTKALAMALGAVGLAILFGPSVAGSDLSGAGSLAGVAAIGWAAVSYAWGSVLARPLIARHGSAPLSGATMLVGGLVLLGPSLLFEPGALTSATTFWGWRATAGWLFLVVFGSLVGYSLYMQLLRDIGPAKAGSFAFVSPAVAVLVGVVAGDEAVSAGSLVGMAVMLLAAGACLYGDALEARVMRARCRALGLALRR